MALKQRDARVRVVFWARGSSPSIFGDQKMVTFAVVRGRISPFGVSISQSKTPASASVEPNPADGTDCPLSFSRALILTDRDSHAARFSSTIGKMPAAFVEPDDDRQSRCLPLLRLHLRCSTRRVFRPLRPWLPTRLLVRWPQPFVDLLGRLATQTLVRDGIQNTRRGTTRRDAAWTLDEGERLHAGAILLSASARTSQGQQSRLAGQWQRNEARSSCALHQVLKPGAVNWPPLSEMRYFGSFHRQRLMARPRNRRVSMEEGCFEKTQKPMTRRE